LIKCNNLIKSYKNNEVLNIDFLQINSKNILGLVGNNGAGKTTFLRSLLNLIKSDSGSVFLNNISVTKSEKWKIFTGSYLDESFLIDYLTPKEYLNIVGELYNLSEYDIKKNLFKYSSFLDNIFLGQRKYLRELSSGNRKKVGLVSAMFVNPKILLLDEPHSNLDPRSQIMLKEHLLKLNKENGTTIIVSSHNLNFVSEICDRIILIEYGKIISDEIVSEKTLPRLNKYFSNQIKNDE